MPVGVYTTWVALARACRTAVRVVGAIALHGRRGAIVRASIDGRHILIVEEPGGDTLLQDIRQGGCGDVLVEDLGDDLEGIALVYEQDRWLMIEREEDGLLLTGMKARDTRHLLHVDAARGRVNDEPAEVPR